MDNELHAGTAAAAAWHTVSLSRDVRKSIGSKGDEACMAAWAIKHRDFVKELIIDEEINRDWVAVSMLDLEGVWCASCVLSVLPGQP